MSKRRKTGNNNANRDAIKTVTVQLRRYQRFAAHNYAYYGVPVNNNGVPTGQSMRIKFTNVFTPDDLNKYLTFDANSTVIIAQIKVFKTVNTVTLWRFENDVHHSEATDRQEYRLSYYYRFKASAVEAFNSYNASIIKNLWVQGRIPVVKLETIESDPWYLIDWEKKIQDLGLCKDSKKHFTLRQCDVIGISLGLDPNTPSRVLQYCISSMDELCYKYGSTIVYFDPYLKFTTENINESEFNTITRTRVSKDQIVKISKNRDDYFFIGRTELHNHKLFIASRELWDAQDYIVQRLYELCYPMDTPYYAERELMLGYVKGKQPVRQAGFNVITNLLSKMLWFNHQVEPYVQQFMDEFNIKSMDDIQKKAIHAAFNENVSIVSGGPGRGKSSCVLKGILNIMDEMYEIGKYDSLSDQYHIENTVAGKEASTERLTQLAEFAENDDGKPLRFVHVVSFTGKAVSRIKEVLYPSEKFTTFEPMTIHRLLMRCKKFKWLRKVPAVIIVDEVSMVSDNLFYKLIRNFSDIKKIIFLGDVDQLPPIQPGDLLSELILSRCIPVTRLVKNYRQGAGSGLPKIADKIIGRESKGKGLSRIHGGWDHALNIPTKKKKDYVTDPDSVFGGCEDCELFGYSKFHDEDEIFNDITKKIVEIRDSKGVDVMIDCVVLTAKRVEVAKLNAKLQSAFMKDYDQTVEASGGVIGYYEGVKFTFFTGDRVMYLENDYDQEIFNGDVGTVVGVDTYNKELKLRLPDTISEKRGSLDDVQPAYACTVHKGQGSEYKIVVIYISDAAQLLHVDQWLYTAFTRARQKVYIFGYNHEITSTVLREMKYRRTFLKHRLQLQFSHSLNDLLHDELQDTPQ